MVTTLRSPNLLVDPPADTGVSGDELKALLGDRRIIFASNRGPVQYALGGRHELTPKRGQGALVTSLTSLLRYARVTWVASCMSAGDREAARRQKCAAQASLLEESLRLRMVQVPARAYKRHYQIFANPILWFIHHSLAGQLLTKPASQVKEAWRWGYMPVNRAMAAAILDELAHPDTVPWVFIHDYHLYLTGHYVRQRAPLALLLHFVHIPWPAPGEGLLRLGPLWREVLHGLLSNDIIGFQIANHARNFLLDCRLSLPGVQVDPSNGVVYYRGRAVRVRVYPISVDVQALREDASSLPVLTYRRRLESLCAEKTMVLVERVDPSKNTLESLMAFRQLLESNPGLAGRVTLLAFLVPSRTAIPEYRRYGQRLMACVKSINERFGTDGYQPIHVFYENNYYQALAGMGLYDVLLVNPVADGMNLVAKEGPIVNQRDGVLVLSEGAGAHAQLSAGSLSVRVGDVDGVVRAMYQALCLPQEERRRRASLLRNTIEKEDLTQWLFRQIKDITLLDAERRPVGQEAMTNC
ncbi:MAG: trehalose-6-phosphate synthase [Dehalococcoidia bacterium]|nr:trehalose-6-phosphate synthase [Dehalococcoidia bacterium]